MKKLDKEPTISNILAKRSPFLTISEKKLREKAAAKGGVKFLNEVAKYVRAEVVYN